MYKVIIKKYGTDEIIETIECTNERSADRVDDGVNINLNHDEYYTIIENS